MASAAAARLWIDGYVTCPMVSILKERERRGYHAINQACPTNERTDERREAAERDGKRQEERDNGHFGQ